MTDAALKASSKATAAPDQMAWDSRGRRFVTIYLPLICFVIVLLFPFYWMTVTSFKPNAELYDYKKYNPFLIGSPTLQHIKHLLFGTAYPHWLFVTMTVAVCSTVLSLFYVPVVFTYVDDLKRGVVRMFGRGEVAGAADAVPR